MTTHTASPGSAPSLNGTADPGLLRVAHTPNFPALSRQLGASKSATAGGRPIVPPVTATRLIIKREEPLLTMQKRLQNFTKSMGASGLVSSTAG